jgi:hypothetical protein
MRFASFVSSREEAGMRRVRGDTGAGVPPDGAAVTITLFAVPIYRPERCQVNGNGKAHSVTHTHTHPPPPPHTHTHTHT